MDPNLTRKTHFPNPYTQTTNTNLLNATHPRPVKKEKKHLNSAKFNQPLHLLY